MRDTWTVVATVLATAAASTVAAPVMAQENQVLLSVDGVLSDYGIADLDGVRHGRVALVHDPAGTRLALHFLRDEPPSTTPPPPAQPPELAPGSDASPQVRALWVWNTAELLENPVERADFLDFVTELRIERVFLYVPAVEGEAPRAGYLPFDGDRLAPFLAELHARGAATYALDGDRDYIRPENHEGVLRTVRRVIEHNRTHRPEERFYGVRYDIEPYLIGGFQGPGRREILDLYVQLFARIAEVAREGGIRVGVDIPFWFDAGDELTGTPFEAELDGRVAPVLEHVTATVDDIGIMAYRTTADGPNGVVLHSTAEVDFGSRGGAHVYVGVETTRIYDEELYTLRGTGREGVPPLPDARWIVAEELGDGAVRVSLVEGQAMLDELATRTSDVDRLRYWFAGQPVPLPGDLISFHSLGADAMWRVASEVEQAFESQPGYLGLAFHDYLGLRELLGR